MNEYIKRTLLIMEGLRPISKKELYLKYKERDQEWVELVNKAFDYCVNSKIKRAMAISYEFSDTPFEIGGEDKKLGEGALDAQKEGFIGTEKTNEIIKEILNECNTDQIR